MNKVIHEANKMYQKKASLNFSRKRIVLSINGAGSVGYPLVKSKLYPLLQTCKNKDES